MMIGQHCIDQEIQLAASNEVQEVKVLLRKAIKDMPSALWLAVAVVMCTCDVSA